MDEETINEKKRRIGGTLSIIITLALIIGVIICGNIHTKMVCEGYDNAGNGFKITFYVDSNGNIVQDYDVDSRGISTDMSNWIYWNIKVGQSAQLTKEYIQHSFRATCK